MEQTWESFLDRSQNDSSRRLATREASIASERLAKESAPPIFEVPVLPPAACINTLPAPSELWRAEWEQVRKRRLEERDELCRPFSALSGVSRSSKLNQQQPPFDTRPASAAAGIRGVQGIRSGHGVGAKKGSSKRAIVCEARSCSTMEAAKPLMAAELMPRWLSGG